MDLTPAISTILIQAHASKPIPPSAKLAERLDSFVKGGDADREHSGAQPRNGRMLTLQNKSIGTLFCPIFEPSARRTSPQPLLHAGRSLPRGIPQLATLGTDVPAYLDDTQREAIDSQIASVLREINGNITNLSSAVSLKHDTATKDSPEEVRQAYGISVEVGRRRWRCP